MELYTGNGVCGHILNITKDDSLHMVRSDIYNYCIGANFDRISLNPNLVVICDIIIFSGMDEFFTIY
jgi:hypothetical protein